MNALDIFLHIGNLFLPALAVAAFAAAASKLVWRRRIERPWWQLALVGFAVGAGVTFGGLVAWGRDGRMATYLVMCVAIAIAQAWLAFARGRG